MVTTVILIATLVLRISFNGGRAQLYECLNGGNGPCVNGACQNASEQCITTATGEVCCDQSQVRVVTTGTTATITTGRPCIDLANPKTGRSDCLFMSRLCSDPRYNEVMRTQCPRTCGFCGVGGTTFSPPLTGVCQDLVNPATGKSDCGSRVSLCKDPIYQTLMSQQCPRTCGYCYQ